MDETSNTSNDFDGIRFRRRSTISFTAIAPPTGARKPFLTRYSSSTSSQEGIDISSAPRERAENGNYRGYVGYRDMQRTSAERLKDLPSHYFKNKNCLDVGCNTGNLTIEVAKKLAPRHILGIDIDADLVGKASARIRNLALHSKATFMVPRALATGQLKDTKKGMDLFPKNIKFECYDIMNDNDDDGSRDKYDTIMCMSVVKWIHLNNGDDGLMKFFSKLHKMCINGGHVVIEYQPWKSYVNNKNASEVCKHNFKNNISIRPDEFERVLEKQIGFIIVERRGTPLSEVSGFNRPILILKKEDVDDNSIATKSSNKNSESSEDNEDSGKIVESEKKGKKKKKKNKAKKRDRDEDGDGVVGSSSDREVEQSNMVKLKKTKFMIPINDD